MSNHQPWQEEVIGRLTELMRQDAGVHALVLVGSLADTGDERDEWCDLDLKVILSSGAVARFFPKSDWLAPFGRLIGASRFQDKSKRSFRVCLEGFRRIDFTFIERETLQASGPVTCPLIPRPYRVIWSRTDDVSGEIAQAACAWCPRDETSSADLAAMIDDFWFKASTAIAKVMRHDLLIGWHLALDLQRDCLVMKMILRDRELGTTIHRFGGVGNELVERLATIEGRSAAERILNTIQAACVCCDDLAPQLYADYTSRTPLLAPTIEKAKALKGRNSEDKVNA